MPKISVLMSAYNCADTIDEAVESICAQSFGNFEFLITDDGSEDDTWQVLQRLAAKDDRLQLFRNTRNRGLAESVNALVAESSGEYIARMDADDVALPSRFDKQVEILDSGKADLCGGWMILFGGWSEAIRNTCTTDEEIRADLLFAGAICQPTVMMRRHLLEQITYDTAMIPAADYDLWTRIAPHAKLYNIPEPLTRYRVHPGQISSRKKELQTEITARIAVRQLAALEFALPEDEKMVFKELVRRETPRSVRHIRLAAGLMNRLITHFDGLPAAQKVIAMRWYRYCLTAGPIGPRAFWLFCRAEVTRYGSFQKWQYLAVGLLTMLHIRHSSRIYQWLTSKSPDSKVTNAYNQR